MNAIKRNQRRAEHHKEVQRLIDQRRAMREAERQRELQDAALEKEREERRRAIIEQVLCNTLKMAHSYTHTHALTNRYTHPTHFGG